MEDKKLIYWGKDITDKPMTWIDHLRAKYYRYKLVKQLKKAGIWDKLDYFYGRKT